MDNLANIILRGHELYLQSFTDENATDLRAARERGMEDRNAEISLQDCPYAEDKSTRRRAVWMISWIRQDAYLHGLDRMSPLSLELVSS